MPPTPSYSPGDFAPASGIYRVIHGVAHRVPHFAVVVQGEQFPCCRTCKERVEYILDQPASHVTHDWDFVAPTALTAQPSANYTNVRAFTRYKVSASLSVDLAPRAKVLQGEVLDVSEGGICAVLSGIVSGTDALVRLSISAPGNSVPLLVHGLLRHRSGTRHGFMFTDLDAAGKDILRALVAKSKSVTSAGQGV